MTNEEKIQELSTRLLFCTKNILFAGTPGGVSLEMVIDAFNGQIWWEVHEGDHFSDFMEFVDAAKYYVEVGGEV